MECIHLPLSDAEVIYFPHLFSIEESLNFYKVLMEKSVWKQETLKLFGKKILVPRLSAWYGDPGAKYTYSGVIHNPLPLYEKLVLIGKKVEEVSGYKFNSVLLNYYRDGNDSMGWHADDEKELGVNPTIASVNFGVARDFDFRRKDNPKEKFRICLGDGSLLLMRGATQHYWQHQLPKRKKVNQGRINLTFRKILF
ncbi:alpha-ketoglutarate-dependent dioxygenase AlkB family protein [Xanthovirga aplysinae]|uniref:alpha-ketoglutarate-dependent dioxygenase AlkB family protein n=1 Tax=Xanthovirga aplysinae TaxID=2529853 RepID=UPI0012BD54D7|nr:alpha-ketoglutarate-dependent dioxygenase AlkB [Xanthovirga aplysinae]MTI32453.1 alpha-ketoglutarate-dependent dioxygenase AlkB [Xanthovirga aplysinae]